MTIAIQFFRCDSVEMKLIKRTTLESKVLPDGTIQLTADGIPSFFPHEFGRQMAVSVLEDWRKPHSKGQNPPFGNNY